MSRFTVYERDEEIFQRWGVAVFFRPDATGLCPRPDLLPLLCLQCSTMLLKVGVCEKCRALYVVERSARTMRTWRITDVMRKAFKMAKTETGRAELEAIRQRNAAAFAERLNAAPPRT